MGSSNSEHTSSCSRVREVDLMRPLLPVCIVLYHSFALLGGERWQLPPSYEVTEPYNWIKWLLNCFTLETFVFISGYLFAFQYAKGRWNKLFPLVKTKFSRLIIPSLVFGFLFKLIFDGTNIFTWGGMLHIIAGVGHLWFLPVLFYCFLICWLLCHLRIGGIVILIMLSVLACMSGYVPVRMNHFGFDLTLYYLFFFYFGFYSYGHRSEFLSAATSRRVLILWLLFIFLFVMGCIIIDQIDYTRLFVGLSGKRKLVSVFIRTICDFSFSFVGLLAYFLSSLLLMKKGVTIEKHVGLMKIGEYSFGIYICHHFVLNLLYLHTSLSKIVVDWALPWVGFAIAFPISYMVVKEFKMI